MLDYFKNKKIFAEADADWKVYDEKYRTQLTEVKKRLATWNVKKTEFMTEDTEKKARATKAENIKKGKAKAAAYAKRQGDMAAYKKKMEAATKAVADKKKEVAAKKKEVAKYKEGTDKYKAAQKLFLAAEKAQKDKQAEFDKEKGASDKLETAKNNEDKEERDGEATAAIEKAASLKRDYEAKTAAKEGFKKAKETAAKALATAQWKLNNAKTNAEYMTAKKEYKTWEAKANDATTGFTSAEKAEGLAKTTNEAAVKAETAAKTARSDAWKKAGLDPTKIVDKKPEAPKSSGGKDGDQKGDQKK